MLKKQGNKKKAASDDGKGKRAWDGDTIEIEDDNPPPPPAKRRKVTVSTNVSVTHRREENALQLLNNS